MTSSASATQSVAERLRELGGARVHVSSAVRVSLLVVFFLAAGAWFSRPLVMHLHTALPYGTTLAVDHGLDASSLAIRPADMHQVLFHQWLFADNLAHGRNPFANPYEFGPLNVEKLHWLGVWGFPAQLLFTMLAWISPVFALNAVLLSTFPVTGLTHYALLRACSVRPLFSFLGSALFTFALARRVQLFSGHMNGALYFTLSLTALLYVLAIRRRSWSWSALAGLSVFQWALGEWHMYYFSALFFPLFVIPVLVSEVKAGSFAALRPAIAKTLPLLAGVLAGGAYLLWYRARFIAGSSAANRTWADLAALSPDPKFLIADDHHLSTPVMYGADVESAIALGVPSLASLAVLLATDAFLRVRAGRSTVSARVKAEASTGEPLQAALLPWLLASGLLFALLSTGARGDRAVGLYSFLHGTLPHFDIIRVPGRMIYLVYFALAVAIPIALQRVVGELTRIWPASARGVRVAAVGVVVLLVAEPLLRAPGVLLSAVLRPPRLAALSQHIPPDEPVLLLPIYAAGSSQGSLAEHFIVATGRSTINGYAPNAPLEASELLEQLMSLNQGTLAPAAHRRLWELGVRHVVQLEGVKYLRPAGTRPGYLQSLERARVLERKAVTSDYLLFELRPPP